MSEFKLAEAFTELTTRGENKFRGVLDKVHGDLKRVQASMDAVGRHAQRMFLVGAGAMAFFVKLAAEAEEATSKFNAVFGEGADDVRAWADELAKSVGRSRIAIGSTLSSFQAFFVGLGYGSKQATEMSKKMQALAIDFASFHDLADEEAAQRFISALSGSSEVLDMFGINIKQAALQQELLSMGLTTSVAKATEQEKAMARLNVIYKAMGEQGAVGDATRTAGSMTNQLKALKARVGELAVEIGTAFIPMAKRMVGSIQEWIGSLGQLSEGQKDSIAMWGMFGTTLVGFIALSAKVSGGIVSMIGAIGSGTIPVLALVGALGLLASAFITAKAEGKTFGEMVALLWTNITGYENAVSRLEKAQREQTEATTASAAAYAEEAKQAQAAWDAKHPEKAEEETAPESRRVKLQRAAVKEAQDEEAREQTKLDKARADQVKFKAEHEKLREEYWATMMGEGEKTPKEYFAASKAVRTGYQQATQDELDAENARNAARIRRREHEKALARAEEAARPIEEAAGQQRVNAAMRWRHTNVPALPQGFDTKSRELGDPIDRIFGMGNLEKRLGAGLGALLGGRPQITAPPIGRGAGQFLSASELSRDLQRAVSGSEQSRRAEKREQQLKAIEEQIKGLRDDGKNKDDNRMP